MPQNANKTRLGIPIQNKAKASQLSYLQQQRGKKSNSKELDKQSKKQENTLIKKNGENKNSKKKNGNRDFSSYISYICSNKNYQIMHNYE